MNVSAYLGSGIPMTRVIFLTVVLAGCGGGSGGGDVPRENAVPAGAGNQGGDGALQACPAAEASTPDALTACGGGVDTICVGQFDGARVTELTAVGAGKWPSWSPDGSQIAFNWELEEVDSIFIVDSDGSGQRWLAAGTQPSWSPDGIKIAFTSAEGIATVKVDDGEITTLVRHDAMGPAFATANSPAWSPDGQKIAYTVWPTSFDDAPVSVFAVNSDGSDRYQVAPQPFRPGSAGYPSWSPSSDRIAVVNTPGSWLGILSISGGAIRWLAGSAASSRSTWSASDDAIVYSADASCGPGGSLHLVDVADGRVEQLIGHADDAALTADGTRIAFVVRGSGATPPTTTEFPAVNGAAETYTIEQPDSLGNVSRYVIYDNGAFELQYLTARFGFLKYAGNFSRSGSRIDFDFDGWSVAGPWEANGTIDGDRLTVEYNTVMMLSDFEDAVYLLDRN